MRVTLRLICFRAQRSGTRTRNRERREADYDYEHECDFYVESCNSELNQAKIWGEFAASQQGNRILFPQT